MRNWRYGLLLLIGHLAAVQAAAPVHAVPVSSGIGSSRIGWRAELSTLENEVSGTVTIVDENTLRVDNFTYNGVGKRVHWMLAVEDTKQAIIDGLIISDDLSGLTTYDGTQDPIFLDLPEGETLEGFHAVSVFCIRVDVNFGSGVFAPTPEPTTLGLSTVAVLCLCARRWRW